MAKATKKNYIVGLDIGSNKVCMLIGVEEEDSIDLLGYGEAQNTGMRRGAIINLDATRDAIAEAMEKAELMSGSEVESVYVSIGGGHIKGFNSRGSIILSEDHPKITAADIARVIAAARAVAIPNDREVIHLLPQEFIVDSDRGVQEPLGFSGRRLEVGVHLVTGSQTSVQNVITCAQDSGLEVKDTVLAHLASALTTLSDDEKELGVALLDIGAGTSDLAVFIDGYLWHTAVLTIAGDHITSDIAVGLRTPIPNAESIKKEKGAALESALEDSDSSIEINSIGEGRSRVIDNKIIVEIINARSEEIFSMIKTELVRVGILPQLNAGIVLTGGTANLRGITDLAEQVFELPARLAYPTGFEGIVHAIEKPQYSTAAGLIRFGYENSKNRAEEKFPHAGFIDRLKRLFSN